MTVNTFIGILPASCAIALASNALAALVTYTDENAWKSATSFFTTINFDEVPPYSYVSDQYARLGVLFTPGDDYTWFDPVLNPSDGLGIQGGWTPQGNALPIFMEFSAPIQSMGFRYPGATKIELFLGGQSIGMTGPLFGFDPWSFAGVISDVPFDGVKVHNTLGGANSMDALFFGAPVPGPASVGVLTLPFLWRSRRTRT